MENKTHYLEQGVLAMSHAVDDWFDGHFGAVMLATYFMITENDLPEHVQAGLLRNADATMVKHPDLLEPYPPEESNPAAYADLIPEYHSLDDMIHQAFNEIRRITPNVRIDGQTFHLTGEAMHGITFAHAILELEQMGYHDIVQAAMKNHRKKMYLNRHRPDYAWEKEIIEPPFVSLYALEYWEKTYNDPHAIKVPYAAVTLLKHLPQEQHAEAEKNICKMLTQVK